MKIEAEDLWPLVLDFIETFFGEEDLQHFKSYFKLKIKHQNDPIVKAGGIQALLGNYLKHNKEVYKQFKKHLKNKSKKQESDSEEESGESSSDDDKKVAKSKDAKAANGKNGKLAGNKRTKKEESDSDSDSDESSDDDNKKKKNAKQVANKRARKNSNASSSSRSRSQSKDSSAKVNGRFTRQRSDSVASEYVPPIKDPKAESQKIQSNFKFSRINEEKYSQMLNEVAADNSFESKARFGMGGGDRFGEWSNTKLRDKVGKGFTKEKNKMKNRNFHSQGERIGYGVNSVKFS